MKSNIENLNDRISEVEQTIEDVKSFKNLRQGSRLHGVWCNVTEEHVVAYVGFYVLVNIRSGCWYCSVTKTLDDVRKDVSTSVSPKTVFTLVGEPLVSDLEKELNNLLDELEVALKAKKFKCGDAPDGWYTIDGNSGMAIGFSLAGIQKGDVIFIKNGIVYMKDHGRFKNPIDQREYCELGIDKNCWNYTVKKLP